MTSGAGEHAAPVVDRPRATACGLRIEKQESGSAMETWSETRSLIVLMAVIAVCYVLGRAVAEML